MMIAPRITHARRASFSLDRPTGFAQVSDSSRPDERECLEFQKVKVSSSYKIVKFVQKNANCIERFATFEEKTKRRGFRPSLATAKSKTMPRRPSYIPEDWVFDDSIDAAAHAHHR